PVKRLVVLSLPPNTLISTIGPSSQRTPVALTRTPQPVSADTTPATSRPSGPAPAMTNDGASRSISAARRWPTIVPAAWSVVAGSVTASTRGTYAASSLAATVGSAATTTPTRSRLDASASARPSVATSVLI